MEKFKLKAAGQRGDPPLSWRRIWREFVMIVDIQFFMMVSFFASNLVSPVALMFIGPLGTLYLDAIGLGMTIFNVFGIVVFSGAITGCDTTMSQSYGTKNKRIVGVYFQKGLLQYGGLLVISISVLLNSEALLLLLNQDPAVARLAGQYITMLCLSLHGYGLYMVVLRYFRVQNVIWPAIVVGFVVLVIAIGLHYLFIHVLHYGISGSAYAQIIAYWSGALAALLITPCQKKHLRVTWPGFTTDALQDWRKFTTLSLAGIALQSMQWWSLELCTILAGTIGRVELAAQAIMFQVNYLIYTIPISVGTSCNILIGQHVGGNRPRFARLNMRIGWAYALTWSIVNLTVLVTLRHYIPMLFTNDPEVVELASETIIFVGVYHVFESVATSSLGMCRGLARQKMGASVCFIGYYVIGLPCALVFTFVLDFNLKGLWSGLSIGLLAESLLVIFLLNRTDWNGECRAAQVRAGLDPDKMVEMYGEDDDGVMDETTALLNQRKKKRQNRVSEIKKRFNSELSSSQVDVSVLTTGKRLTKMQLVFYRGGFFAMCTLILVAALTLRAQFELSHELVDLVDSENVTLTDM